MAESYPLLLILENRRDHEAIAAELGTGVSVDSSVDGLKWKLGKSKALTVWEGAPLDGVVQAGDEKVAAL